MILFFLFEGGFLFFFLLFFLRLLSSLELAEVEVKRMAQKSSEGKRGDLRGGIREEIKVEHSGKNTKRN